MRERRPGDWVADLSGRHELEHRMATALAAHPALVLLKRATTSMTELDYAIAGAGDRLAQVELKAKHQAYRGWGQFRPELAEKDLFILDELSLRKIIEAGRYAYLVVADLPGGRWCVWSALDLVLASKVRTVRALATPSRQEKAKVLLDLRESAVGVADEHKAVDEIARMLEACDAHWAAIGPWPYGRVVRDPTRRTS